MALDIAIETNPGEPSCVGIILTVEPITDPNAQIEVWRAPDSGGAPGTAVQIFSGFVPASGMPLVDILPITSTTFWYRSRAFGGPYGVGQYNDWVNLGAPGVITRETLLSLQFADVTSRGPAWEQAHQRIGPQGNILPNPGFEDGESFWTRDPTVSWSYTIPNVAAEARSGNRYLKPTSTTGVVAQTFAADDVGRTRYFEVNTNDLIQFGGYAYRVSGTANCRYVLELTNKDKGSPLLVTTPNVTSAAWTLTQAQTIVGSGYKYARFYAEIDATGVGTAARFDDVFMRIALTQISDVPAPNTLYQIRFANAVADPDTVDGMQTYIDFPATTNFMRVGQTPLSIASSTNATPIQMTVNGHGYTTGDRVTIRGHLTNTNANGSWSIVVTGNDTFTLTGSTGNGVGGATGHAVKLSLIIAPNGALTVFATVVANILNAITATISGLLSALGGMLVRNTFQHSTTGAYLATTVNRILMENNTFKLMGDVGTGTNNENVRIGDYTVSLPPTARSTTNLNDPVSGARGWTDPDSSPPSVTYQFTGNGTWIVPRDWNNGNNSIIAIGAGANGGNGTIGAQGGAGGGGGEHRSISNVTFTVGATVTITCGDNSDSVVGSTLTAKKANGSAGGTAGSGGTGRNGGSGGSGSASGANKGGGGGGGAGGDTAAGTNGSSGTSGAGGAGGAGGTTGGGTGGAGAILGTSNAVAGGNGSNFAGGGGGGGHGGGGVPENDGAQGGNYGAGGGGAGVDAESQGVGGGGIGGVVRITYTPVANNGLNSAARTSDGTTTISSANRLYQKLGDATEGANIPSYDNNYSITFRIWADGSNYASGTGTVQASVTAEYSTDSGSNWTALGGSWSVTAGGSGSAYPATDSGTFTPTLVVPGTPAHVWFRLTLAVTTTNGGGAVGLGHVQCFDTTYLTNNFAATWFTASGTANRRGYKGFATQDGSSVWQPHASLAPVGAVGTNMVEGEVQFVGGNVHGLAYQDDEAARYVSKLIGTEVNKTTTAASDTKITTGIKIKAEKLNAAGRMLRVRASGTIGANTGTVRLRFGTANSTADTAIATLSLASGESWVIDTVIIVQSTGGPGTSRLGGMSIRGTTVAVIAGTLSVTTTSDNFLNITGQTTSGVTLTMDTLHMEWLFAGAPG